jgi:hypothetical protein
MLTRFMQLLTLSTQALHLLQNRSIGGRITLKSLVNLGHIGRAMHCKQWRADNSSSD